MGKRQFRVTVTRDLVLEIDDAVIAVVDDAWRKTFYNLHDATDIAAHVGYNRSEGTQLSGLDGFANLPNDLVRVLEEDRDTEAVEIHAVRRGNRSR